MIEVGGKQINNTASKKTTSPQVSPGCDAWVADYKDGLIMLQMLWMQVFWTQRPDINAEYRSKLQAKRA